LHSVVASAVVGDHGGIQWQFVEDDQRQQRLDRAGW